MTSKALKPAQAEFADLALREHGEVIGYPEINDLMERFGVKKPWWLINDIAYRAGRGKFRVPSDGLSLNTSVAKVPVQNAPAAPTVALKVVETAPEAPLALPAATTVTKAGIRKASSLVSGALVPQKAANYVPFGNFKDLKEIIDARMFYPVFVTGLSGNGKTLMVEEICARAKRECFRVNITIETDEDDLLGGFRLQDGDTVWFDGPVVEAMRRGGVLLLDEIDLASNKVMCLQPVLEGKGVFLKKVNEWVRPAPGFTIVATANTKGKGDEEGRFIGTNILNEAFLERFPVTLNQEYPSVSTEKKIVTKNLESNGRPDGDYASALVNWADAIRKTFLEGGTDEIITTRRLVHITKAYGIFGNRMKAIEMCLNRFDDETKSSFLDLYTKLDADAEGDAIAEAVDKAEEADACSNAGDMQPF